VYARPVQFPIPLLLIPLCPRIIVYRRNPHPSTCRPPRSNNIDILLPSWFLNDTITPTPAGTILRLSTSVQPVFFSTELEYLYTARDFGAVFEFLFNMSEKKNKLDGHDVEENKIDKLILAGWAAFLLVATNQEKLLSFVVRQIIRTAKDNKEFREMLGKAIRPQPEWWLNGDPWIEGSINVPQGNVDVSFRLKGHKGSGTLYFTSVRKAKGEPFTIRASSLFLLLVFSCSTLCFIVFRIPAIGLLTNCAYVPNFSYHILILL